MAAPLRLLSIGKSVFSMLLQANKNAKNTASDGGGIRGLSSLYILQRIMKALQKKAGERAHSSRTNTSTSSVVLQQEGK
jgi:hypothetical protein